MVNVGGAKANIGTAATEVRKAAPTWGRGRHFTAACAIAGLLAVGWPARARAGDRSSRASSRASERGACAVSDYEPVERDRDRAMLEAGSLAANGRYADARGVYLWVLARHADDAEALFGLARVDSWGGCWSLAHGEYRELLAVHPEDSDVRAGYVDLLVWSGRLDEAERVLREGLARDARSPELLARQARFASWRGDAALAEGLADEAERAAPDDGELRALRDRLFVGEARLTAHADAYPSGYQSLFSLASQVLQRAGRFELYGGAQLLARYAGTPGTKPVQDGYYPFGALYHPARGVTLGGEVAFGAPAVAIPELSLKASALVPLAGPFDAFVAYSRWWYAGGEIVDIVNPSIGVALPHDVRLDARAWISAVELGPRRSVVGAGGAQITWSATPRLDAGLTYTYGAESDQIPALYQLVEFRSHVATAFVDFLLGRHGGVRPLVGAEYRTPADIVIGSFEVSAYARW